MKCEQLQECLTAFLLGDLDEATRSAVETHLEQCEGCRAQRRELELTLDLVRDALSASSSTATIPQKLTPDRRARIVSEPSVRRPIRVLRWFSVSHPQFAFAAAACLVIAFIIVGMMLPAVSSSREKARGAKLCLAGPVPEAPLSLSVVPIRKAQHKGEWAVPSDAPALPEATHDYSDAARERQPVNIVRSPREEATKRVGDSTETIVYLADQDLGRTSAGKMGGGGAPGGGDSKPRAKAKGDGDGTEIGFALTPAQAPRTPPPSAAPPASAVSAPMKRHEAFDGDAGGELRAQAVESGEAASRTASSAPGPARKGSGGGRLFSEDSDVLESKPGEAKADLAQERDARKILQEGRDSLRRRTYSEKGAVDALGTVSEGAATVRGKQAANASPVAQQGQQTGVPIVGRLFSDVTGKEKEEEKREAKSGAVDELYVRGHSSRGPAAADRGYRTADAEVANGWTSDTSLRRVTEESARKGQPQAEFEVRSESRLAGAAEVKELQRKPTTDNKAAGPYFGHYLNPVALKPTETGGPKSPDVSDKSYAEGGRTLEKELAQARNAPGMDSNRKFDDGKKGGDRGDDRKALAESPRKVETTSLFGPSMSMVPVSEPTQLPAKFRAFGVNPFVECASQPFSTFSIDVDTASYTVSRNYMLRGQRPPAEAVRTEDFVNFFDYAYAAPTRETFRVYAEAAPSKFGHGLQLVKIGVKGKRLGREEQRGAILTFLVDTSGSMDKPDRIGLIRKSLKMLLEKLNPQDLVAIVQFDSNVRLALDHTPASEKEKIAGVLDALQCSGSTHLEGGMVRAYEVAARSFNPKAENRVLILSDGVANLGTMAAEDILAKVEVYRKQGIYCSVFGFGIGTFDDTMLQTLANKGNGAYAFIDSENEAKRVFVDDLAATLNTIAADVKIQVEFNPKRVAKYRQIGYEKRQLKKEDFRNDAVDAGEVGSGQSVTALYEVELKDGRDALATVRLRYRRTDNNRVEEVERAVTAADLKPEFEKADARFRLAACAAEFSELLRGSPHAAGTDFSDVANLLRPVALELPLDTQVRELLRLVQSAASLSLATP
jgi:Ca-activated chloride channel family protein